MPTRDLWRGVWSIESGPKARLGLRGVVPSTEIVRDARRGWVVNNLRPNQVKIACFAVEGWTEIGRRPQHLMEELAHYPEVASILYINPPISTSIKDVISGRFAPSHLGAQPDAHLRAVLGRSQRISDKMWLYTGSTKTLPLTRFESIRKMGWLNRLNMKLYVGLIKRQLRYLPGETLVVWLTYVMQAYAIDAFPERSLLCYDWTDDWAQFERLPVADVSELISMNDRILKAADVVFAVSASLHQRARTLNPRSFRVPNASNLTLLGEPSIDPPEVLRAIPGPRLGYVGMIGDRIDFSLLRRVARSRPNWSLVMVGPVWANHRDEADDLGALANVHFLGPQPYGELPAFLAQFDVCLIPHTVDPLTSSMDPVKLYDYLAMGKPIVATGVAGVERFADVVYMAQTPEQFLAGLEAALCEDGSKAGRRLAYARKNTWPQRAEQIWKIIGEVLSRQGVEY